MLALTFALILEAAAADRAEPDRARAEACYAQAEAMIRDSMAETGRVAAPSWFIRDWWAARLDAEITDAGKTALLAARDSRRIADREASRAEAASCAGQAITAGAVPGMGPG